MERSGYPQLPVDVITGFLGSGKTTLLRALLGHPALSDAAVIINEFGEVGLDHRLVRAVTNEIVLLPSGCICCAVHDDLVETLRELAERRATGELPPFRRVIIETSGLADPTSIASTLLTNYVVAPVYRLHLVVTTIDSVFGRAQLSEHPEAGNQIALADRVVVTKVDLSRAEDVAALDEAIRRINPIADILVPNHTREVNAALLLQRPWIDRGAARPLSADAVGPHRHSGGVTSIAVRIPHALDWDDYMAWIDRFVAEHGQHLLRLKGVLHVAGREHPLAVHGIHHLLFPPEELPTPFGDSETGLLVLILRGVDAAPVIAGLRSSLDAHPL